MARHRRLLTFSEHPKSSSRSDLPHRTAIKARDEVLRQRGRVDLIRDRVLELARYATK